MNTEKIELIADSVRAKPINDKDKITIPESVKITPENEILYKPTPLKNIIFKARDIIDFTARKEFLISIIEKEKSYSITPQYYTPDIKSISIENKTIWKAPEQIQYKTNYLLITQCETEIKIINDLLILQTIAKEYLELSGKNEKIYYLQYAKEGQTKNELKGLGFYTEIEFAEIVELMIKEIDNNQDIEQITEINSQTNRPLLQWNGSINTLYTLFFDLLTENVITWNGKTSEGAKMEVARMLEMYFVDSKTKPLSIETIKQALKPNTPKAKKRIQINKKSLLNTSHTKKI